MTFLTKLVNYLLDCFSQVFGDTCRFARSRINAAYSDAQWRPAFRAECSAPGFQGVRG